MLSYREVKTVRRIADHDCRLKFEEPILNRYICDGLFVELRRKFRRFMLISISHPMVFKVFKSTTQINLEEARHISQHYYMIHPFSKFANLFFMINCALVLVYVLILPLEIVFQYPPLTLMLIRCVLDVVSILSVFTNFAMGVWDRDANKVQLYWKEVARSYVKGHFIPDILSLLPISLLIWYTQHYDWIVLKLFYILKLFRIPHILRHFETVFRKTKIWWYWDYIELFFLIIVSVWWMSALLMLCRQLVLNSADSSTTRNYSQLVRETATNRIVIKSIYDAILALLLINDLSILDDIVDLRVTLLQGVTTLVGGLLYLLMFVHIYQIFNKHAITRKKYESHMQQLDEYMRYKEVPPNTQSKILRYIEVRFNGSIYNFQDIYFALSKIIRHEVRLHTHMKNLRRVEFLKDVPVAVILAIIKRLRLEIYFEGDTLITAGLSTNSMFFLHAGVVAVYSQKNEELCHLSDGSHFGELSMVVNEPRVVSVRAVTDCRVFKLTRRDFNEAIDIFPDMPKIIKKSALMKIAQMKKRFKTMSRK